jgi:hypothetical protein
MVDDPLRRLPSNFHLQRSRLWFKKPNPDQSNKLKYKKAGGIEIRPLSEHQKLSYLRNI